MSSESVDRHGRVPSHHYLAQRLPAGAVFSASSIDHRSIESPPCPGGNSQRGGGEASRDSLRFVLQQRANLVAAFTAAALQSLVVPLLFPGGALRVRLFCVSSCSSSSSFTSPLPGLAPSTKRIAACRNADPREVS
ncbi:hypothetical protein M440DRAFT_1004766 [Trichoderma longibrachiatum ATCC 18648]|uniref:Uncharacterized protein n=1 Tax=Trichoderma longibrachiatum ATCC 18648 TaxID=983965 RepID=A0A2T4CHJ9_TRILO|nr:hypothetical protein M440DRAFT_1004766 [Trichoderma longibrachiatum ATCC 18648]